MNLELNPLEFPQLVVCITIMLLLFWILEKDRP